MIFFLGNFFLILSLLFALLQLVNSNKNRKNSLIAINKVTSIGLLLSALFSFFLLIYAHIISDFTLVNVFENSHTTKPLIYKISGVWGNHEGSMLLWILVLTIFNYFIFRLYNKSNSHK